MQKTIVAATAALFLCSGTLGCKSAPKLAWWKKGDPTGVESTALAHSAPSLPADIAKQAERLAATSPSIEMSAPSVQLSANQAPPYSPSSATVAATPTPPLGSGQKAPPTAYPSTGAPAYSAAAATSIATTTPAMPAISASQSADLGSLDMPYNPGAVPPAKTVVAATQAVPKTVADRYGRSSPAISSPPAYGGGAPVPPVTIATTSPRSGGSRYGNITSAPTTPATSPSIANMASSAAVVTTSPNSLPTSTASASTTPATPAGSGLTAGTEKVAGDRYAAITPVTPPAPPNVSPAATVVTAPTPPASAVASASTYRPGGTTSYQGSVAEFATRPNPVEQQVPNVALPGMMSEPSETPRYR